MNIVKNLTPTQEDRDALANLKHRAALLRREGAAVGGYWRPETPNPTPATPNG